MVVGNVWKNLELKLDVSALMGLGPRKFVRDSVRAGDLKTYDAGFVVIATVTGANTNTIGKLFVEYDIEFFTPQVNPELTPKPVFSSCLTCGPAPISYVNNTPQNVPFNTFLYDPLLLQSAYNTTTREFTLRKGMYRVTFAGIASNSAAENFTVFARINLNGQAVGGQGIYQMKINSASAPVFPIYLTSLVPSTSTGVLSISITMVGAAGTLFLSEDACLYVEPA
jgi:hypothetical protein